MTVAVGFNCSDGVVVGTDSEISIGDESKFPGRKAWYLRFLPPGHSEPGLRVSMAGAGSTDAFAMFVEAAKAQLTAGMTLDDVQAKLGGILIEIHKQHIEWRTEPERGALAFHSLVGARVGNETRLLKTVGTIVTQVKDYAAIGIGASLAQYIIQSINPPQAVKVTTAALIATEALRHAKQHVQYCGGKSDLIVIYNNRDSGYVAESQIARYESLLVRMDKAITPVLHSYVDPSVDGVAFQQRLDAFAQAMATGRGTNVSEIARQLDSHVQAGPGVA